MAGEDQEFDGEARLADGFSRGYLSQEPRLNPELDVWGNLQEAIAPRRAIVDRYHEIGVKLSEPLDDRTMQKLCDEMARLQDRIDAENLWELDHEIEIAMDVMNLPPRDAAVQRLSGGERRRVALCKLLLQKPDLLLLDEPTNHLDAEAVNWLERHLAEYHGTVVAVTHDRYFLDNVAQWILELDRGRGIPWEGNYSSWLEQKRDRLGREEKSSLARQKSLQRELEWVRMAPRARQAKSKARIKAYEQLASESFEERLDEFEIQIPPGKHLGDLVVEATDVCKRFDDTVLIEDLTFRLPAGGIVGIIGPNGAGKTTLFHMITGGSNRRRANCGSVRRSNSAASIRIATPWIPRTPCFRRFPAAMIRSRWGARRSTRGPMCRDSISAVRIRRRRSGTSPVASGTEFTWRSCCAAVPTCCCWTNPRTTWTWTPCGPWRKPSSITPGASWSSVTTAGSSTGSPRTFWLLKGTGTSIGVKETLPPTNSSGGNGWGSARTNRNDFATRNSNGKRSERRGPCAGGGEVAADE